MMPNMTGIELAERIRLAMAESPDNNMHGMLGQAILDDKGIDKPVYSGQTQLKV